MKKREKILLDHSSQYLNQLCSVISGRSVGSEGNRQSTEYFESILSSFGWRTERQEFDAIDWQQNGATLKAGNLDFKAFVSPYSSGFSGSGELAIVSNIAELKNGRFQDKILLLHSDIAKEQLMPKNFVFYNPEEHKRIIAALEQSKAAAIICATGRNPSLAGGVYPFPLIEDGDFDIPSVYMTEEEGKRLLSCVGGRVILHSASTRIPGKGCNIIGRIGKEGSNRVVITAHIDAKKGTPGAIDNGTGVAVLLILAELLTDYSGNRLIEIVALNGEDYYAVSGQMKYITENRDGFKDVLLNINIDGAGYKNSKSAFSFFDLSLTIHQTISALIGENTNIVEGVPWLQGDHSIFLQYGRPAIAVSSEWFINNIDSQTITHTEKDNLNIVDYEKVVEIAVVLDKFVRLL